MCRKVRNFKKFHPGAGGGGPPPRKMRSSHSQPTGVMTFLLVFSGQAGVIPATIPDLLVTFQTLGDVDRLPEIKMAVSKQEVQLCISGTERDITEIPTDVPYFRLHPNQRWHSRHRLMLPDFRKQTWPTVNRKYYVSPKRNEISTKFQQISP